MVVLTVQKFKGIETIGVEFDWASRVSENQWELEELHLWELKNELIAFPFWDEDYPEGTETLIRRLRGAVDKALKESGNWRMVSSEHLQVKKCDGKSDGISMSTLGLMAFRVYENERGYTRALDLKFQSGEVIHIETMGSIAQGLNKAGYLGGEWIDPPQKLWKWFGGKEE